MFIQPISNDVAADFVQAYEDLSKSVVHAGGTSFLPCKTASNDNLYVMFGPLGDAAILGEGAFPKLDT